MAGVGVGAVYPCNRPCGAEDGDVAAVQHERRVQRARALPQRVPQQPVLAIAAHDFRRTQVFQPGDVEPRRGLARYRQLLAVRHLDQGFGAIHRHFHRQERPAGLDRLACRRHRQFRARRRYAACRGYADHALDVVGRVGQIGVGNDQLRVARH
ncbi:hypothetical protein D3C85_794490 [compost metagenome]